MMTDFDNIGIHFEEKQDIFEFAQANMQKMKFGSTTQGGFAVLPMGKKIQIWYYGDQEHLYPYSMEMFHKEPEPLRGTGAEWVNMPKGNDSALLNILMCDGDFPIPLNIEIIDAFLWRNNEISQQDGVTSVETTWYAKQIEVIKKEFETEPSGEEMAPESLIPCGTFPARDNDENWKPSATALMNGLVVEANLRHNKVTGNKYWHLKVSCLGYTFFVAVAREYVEGTIEPGDHIEGFYWISGKICE